MAEQASEAAVLFADISGSTKLYESAGNAVAHAAVENCVNLMRQKTEAAKGRVVKTIGDEVMAIFPRADDAADAAIEMQLAVSALPPVGETALGIRVGCIRGVKGVVIGQLLVSIIGYGALFELYSRNFLMKEFWALTILLFAFAILLSEGIALLEKRVEYYAGVRS